MIVVFLGVVRLMMFLRCVPNLCVDYPPLTPLPPF